MFRHYITKTERCMYPDGYILKAVKKVVAEEQKVCDSSKETSIPKRSLLSYVKNILATGIQDEVEATKIIGGYQKPLKVNPLIIFLCMCCNVNSFLFALGFKQRTSKQS
jgi:hypothetical protein